MHIPLAELNGTDGSVVDALQAQHSEAGALRRLEALHGVRHVLQYSLNPLHELVRFDLLRAVHREDDAFTLGLRSVLGNLCGRRLLPDERCAGGGALSGAGAGVLSAARHQRHATAAAHTRRHLGEEPPPPPARR